MKKIIFVFMWLLLSFVSFVSATEYIYFHGQWCPHCAKVDEYLKSVDWYEKLKIQDKEVYFNQKNAQEMSDYGKKLSIPESDLWVPFLVIKDWDKYDYKIWDQPIIEQFRPILWEPVKNNNKIYVISWIIIFLLSVVVGIILKK